MCAVKAREVEHEVVETSQALLIFDRRLQCRPLSESDRWKGAEKLDRVSPAG